MGIFEELAKNGPREPQPVVKSVKRLHKGFLMGHISNGDGIVKLDNGFAIKFVVQNSDFVTLYLLDYGTGVEIPTQTYQKTKSVEIVPNIDIEKKERRKTELF